MTTMLCTTAASGIPPNKRKKRSQDDMYFYRKGSAYRHDDRALLGHDGAITGARRICVSVRHLLRLVLNRKSENGSVIKNFSGFQTHRRKVWLIGRVGEELSLQAEAVPRTIDAAGFSFSAFRQEVAGVELDAGKRGANAHGNAGFLAERIGCRAEHTDLSVDYIIVVISSGIGDLREMTVHMMADFLAAGQIH